jgi:hypothetical protein
MGKILYGKEGMVYLKILNGICLKKLVESALTVCSINLVQFL